MNCAFHIMVICKFDHVNCRKTYEQFQKTENIDKQIPVDAKKNDNRETCKINCNATRNVRINEITKNKARKNYCLVNLRVNVFHYIRIGIISSVILLNILS